MSEITKFECDVTGEYYGAKNNVMEFEIRKHDAISPYEIRKETVHIAFHTFQEYDIPYPARIKYLAHEDGEIVGVKMGFIDSENELYYKYKKREHIMTDRLETFMEFVEEHILY